MINDMLINYNHTGNCRVYLDLNYLCETVDRIEKKKDARISLTIHDVLAFRCLHCGHGEDEYGYGGHSMFECKQKCCGNFLDRQSLQYLGGDCECGKHILAYLGVKPASEKQNEWRRNLFLANCSRGEANNVERVLKPIFMKIIHR